MKLNLACGPHLLDGFENLDKETGWRFEDGLGEYADGSIEALTISHALMYLPLEHWGRCFAEFARVLEPGGVVRITEDATDNPESERYGGFHDAVTLTSLSLVSFHLLAAGLEPTAVGHDQSWFRDGSLCQNWHGGEPKVFFVEGIKQPSKGVEHV